jgi:general secretion pathway protein A
MYLDHFGLQDYPFSTSPDPRFYYPSAKHREALACLIYAVEQRKGFALISGEVGAGKTMLCRAALQRLGDGVESAMLCHTSITPTQFLKAIAAEFGLNPWKKSKMQVVSSLRDFLVDRRKHGRTVVLIVDEAQALSAEVLEEVRLLGNLETATEKLVQTVLVGQPELRQLVGQHRLRQLDQRIAVKFHLGALSQEDVGAYVEHRLHVAGGDGRILFGPAAKAEVGHASRGIPRLVNSICDQALLQAFVSDEPAVSVETVRRVVTEREGYYMDRPELMVDADEAAQTALEGSPRKARLKCPKCSVRLTVYEDDAGSTGLCPRCGISLRVPADIFSSPAPARMRPAQGAAQPVPAEAQASPQDGLHKTGEDYPILGSPLNATSPSETFEG